MEYITKTYGNKIDFAGTCLPRREREIAMWEDKARIVEAACLSRSRKSEIRAFDGYHADAGTGIWTIRITATRRWHRRFARILRDPSPALARWARQEHRKALRRRRELQREARREARRNGKRDTDTAPES